MELPPALSPEDLLAHLLTLTHAMDDLEILIGTAFLTRKNIVRFLALQWRDTDFVLKQ